MAPFELRRPPSKADMPNRRSRKEMSREWTSTKSTTASNSDPSNGPISGMSSPPRVEGEDLLSLWTADMDFRAPEAVIARLREAADHGIYGYTRRDPRPYEIVQSWFARRHNWSPVLETLLPAPAIMPSVAAILRTFTKPGDGVIVQSPVYSPYFEVIQGNGRVLLT
ncbi:MAG: hypothetical protein E5V24_00900, partial [Mesorhizobium sp.]